MLLGQGDGEGEVRTRERVFCALSRRIRGRRMRVVIMTREPRAKRMARRMNLGMW